MRKDDAGEGEPDLGDALDDDIAPAAVVAADEADDHTTAHGDGDRQRRHAQRFAPTPEHTAEHIASQIVGAEEVCGAAGRFVAGAVVLVERVVRRQQRRQQGEEEDQQQAGEADHRGYVAPQGAEAGDPEIVRDSERLCCGFSAVFGAAINGHQS